MSATATSCFEKLAMARERSKPTTAVEIFSTAASECMPTVVRRKRTSATPMRNVPLKNSQDETADSLTACQVARSIASKTARTGTRGATDGGAIVDSIPIAVASKAEKDVINNAGADLMACKVSP